MSEPRVVVVTGGSRGLGAGLMRAFLALGDVVATCSRSPSELTDVWASDPQLAGRFHDEVRDMTDATDRAELVAGIVERFGGIDVLVNNSGIARDGVLALVQAEDVDAVIDLSLKATLDITRLVSRRMLRQRSGRIVNISSVVGLSGYRGLAVHAATKAALDGLTRSLSRELGPRGITVNSVAPGYLRTEMSHGLDEEQLRQISRRPPGRLGEPKDVAAAVTYLASCFINGHVLVVDGGLTA